MLQKTKKIIKRVAFFGDAMIGENTQTFKMAEDTAELLAKNGYIIVNGGGPGVMLAATNGAKRADGRVELVIIDSKSEPGNYEGTDKKNLAYAQKTHIVKSIEKRMDKLIEIADAFVIFKGGTGTLSEVGMVWELAKFEYGHHEPLIFVGKEWEEVVKTLTKSMGFENIEKRVVVTVDTPNEVLRALDGAGN